MLTPEEEKYFQDEDQRYAQELESRMTFGKYKGQTIEFVLENNPSYIVWANENVQFFEPSNRLMTDAANLKSIKDAHWRGEREDKAMMMSGFDWNDYYD